MAIVKSDFDSGAVEAEGCSIKIALPTWTLGFKIPPIPFPPPLPIPRLSLVLSCDPSKPLDVSAGVEWGGGRKSQVDKSPDDDEEL